LWRKSGLVSNPGTPAPLPQVTVMDKIDII
jgi:hypothetical protein